MAHFSGLVAGKAYPNPCDHAHVVTSTTHKVLRGPRGGESYFKMEKPESDRLVNSILHQRIQQYSFEWRVLP